VDMMFESDESLRIECSTTVILKGRQVVEKIQVEEGRRALGKTLFELKDSVMCDVMVEFIEKLRSVDTPAVVNTVLENFSVLQVSVCTTLPHRSRPRSRCSTDSPMCVCVGGG
jgi:hypothetical protein